MEDTSENQIKMYLESTFAIDSENKNIIETATRLTQDCSNDEQKAVKLFYFVRDSIPYNIFMISVFIEDFRASRILEWSKGYCVQKAVLLTALGRASNIPTRLALSPMPITVTSTKSAPALNAETALAVAMPKSLCV